MMKLSLTSSVIGVVLLLIATVTAQDPPVDSIPVPIPAPTPDIIPVLDSCSSQYDCIFFTMERNTTRACGSGSCDYRVCMNIDYTRKSCKKGLATNTIASSCPKNSNTSMCHLAPGFNTTFATKRDGITTGYRECQTVRAGNVAEFILSDGGKCSDSLDRTLVNTLTTLPSGLNVQCRPYMMNNTHRSCTGNMNNADCSWRIRTPTTCINGPFNTGTIQDEFDTAILRANEALNRTIAANIALNITQLMKVASVPDSIALRNITNAMNRTFFNTLTANAAIVNLTTRALTWTNTTGFSSGLENALRAARDADNELRLSTLVADNFTLDKRFAEETLLKAYDQCLVANNSYTLIRNEVFKMPPAITARVNVATQAFRAEDSVKFCIQSYNRLVTATKSFFNITAVRSEYNRVVTFVNETFTQLNISMNIVANYTEGLRIANDAAIIATRAVAIVQQFEIDSNTSDIPSILDINILTTARIEKCGKNNWTCNNLINTLVNSARKDSNDAWKQANKTLENANAANIPSSRTTLNLTMSEFNETLNDINEARAFLNLPLDGYDDQVLSRNIFLKRYTDCKDFEDRGENELQRILSNANNASKLIKTMPFDLYQVEASSLVQEAFKYVRQCKEALYNAMNVCKSNDPNPVMLRRISETCRALADNANYTSNEVVIVIETQKVSIANTASQRNAESTTELERKQLIDDSMKRADDAFTLVQNILTQSFALQMNCTDSTTQELLVRVSNSVFKTAGQRKRTSDLALQGLSDDTKRMADDVTNTAIDTQKLLDLAKRSCEVARKANEREIASRSTSLSLLPKDCATYKEYMLDFEDAVTGQYITDYYKDTYNVMITATGGYSPELQLNAARIFDSSNPVGDPDLGSPNIDCGTGGKGIGAGGKPSSPYPNCAPQKKVLIIQRNNGDEPDDNEAGGVITFTFNEPVIVDSIGLMDLDDINKLPIVNVYTTDSADPIQIATTFTGDNGLLPLSIKETDVTKIEIRFSGGGAVTFVRYLKCLARKTDDLYIHDSDGPDLPTPSPPGGNPVGGCIQDVYSSAKRAGNLVCGKKNVYFEKVASLSRGTCIAGETIALNLRGSLTLRTGRYDLGWYVATDGGEALKGRCVMSILDQSKQYRVVAAPNSTRVIGTVEWNNDFKPNTLDKNDACGDVFTNGGAGTIDLNDLLVNQNVKCVDKNDDGSLDIAICITFRVPNQDDKCDPAGPYPGDSNSCYCSRYNIPQISVITPDTRTTTKC